MRSVTRLPILDEFNRFNHIEHTEKNIRHRDAENTEFGDFLNQEFFTPRTQRFGSGSFLLSELNVSNDWNVWNKRQRRWRLLFAQAVAVLLRVVFSILAALDALPPTPLFAVPIDGC